MPRSESAGRLEHLVSHLAHLLPAQGPIGVFIHHNTLHAFQHLPFEQAVLAASEAYGTEPYMREEAYRQALRDRRIRPEDIDAVLEREEDGPVGIGGLTRRSFRKLLLCGNLLELDARNVFWMLEDGVLDAALVASFQRRLEEPAAPPSIKPRRPRDGVLARYGVDLDDIIHPVLVRIAGAFLDQGVAYWTMPDRGCGFLLAARALFQQSGFAVPAALDGVREAFTGVDGSAAESILASMEKLGVQEAEWEEFLRAELLALPGWAGMFRRLEEEPHLAPHDRLPCSLMDFLAVRLVLTVTAAANAAGDAKSWRIETPASSVEDRQLLEAAMLSQAARICGLGPLASMSEDDFRLFRAGMASLHPLERRRLLHLAYERRHERQILVPLAKHRRDIRSLESPAHLAAQVFFCIDEREESIRRHLEEIDPEIETFGAAGFFGVAVNYHGIDDAHEVPLCPVVVTPQHRVMERPHEQDHHLFEGRKNLRRLWAGLAWNSYISTRTLFRGWLSTTVLGIFSLFPLAAKVLAPRRFSKVAAWLNDSFLPEPRTELTYMRSGEAGHQATDGLAVGFTVAEKVDRVASVLGPAGLHKGMARLVVVLGHGSTSLNNPHESAHDCGACGGRRGGPNGRLFAAIANRPEVRLGLRDRGIWIPEDTWFIGGYHDTCNDDIELYDLDRMPASHEGDLARVRASLDQARAWSAHERARRFEAAAWGIDSVQALHHVEERAEHLAEPRPEYGHCTNSVCIVGRRAVTRGLFFDRRAFLISYDATLDASGENLGRLLGAVIPVCAGISLEYYFSFVDNEGYGCGTKLPHNITGLIGVMNGYESDLRTGLPWQMVEIHEPVRILFVVEATPEILMGTIRKNPLLAEFVENRWIRMAAMDPGTGTIQVYRDGVFEPLDSRAIADDERLHSAKASAAWYAGKREHLPVARIEREMAVAR